MAEIKAECAELDEAYLRKKEASICNFSSIAQAIHLKSFNNAHLMVEALKKSNPISELVNEYSMYTVIIYFLTYILLIYFLTYILLIYF